MGFVTTCVIADVISRSNTLESYFIQMIVSPYYMWAIYMSILDSFSLAQMKNRKHESQFWGDERKTKQRQTTRKRHPQNGRTQRQLLQGINEQGDLGKPQQRFPSETKSSGWGLPQRAMVKEGWQIPAGLAQMQHRASQKKAVCLVPLLCEAFNQR